MAHLRYLRFAQMDPLLDSLLVLVNTGRDWGGGDKGGSPWLSLANQSLRSRRKSRRRMQPLLEGPFLNSLQYDEVLISNVVSSFE